ncbi:MAG: hypothetical protein OEL76_02455 [Siculibacillus sp.]|nr:hypothetical protein [Siculibacillus sp.]
MAPRTRALIGLLGLAAAGAAALVLWRGTGPGLPATSPTPLRIEIGGRPLTLPANTIRFADQRVPGPHLGVDLALTWPELEGRSERTAARFDTPHYALDVVHLSIRPRQDTWDSASRLAAVYARFFIGEPWPGPAGLQGRRLSPKSGYADEVVYHEPGAVRPFVARCFPLAAGEPPKMCLRDVLHGNLLVTLRFPEVLLEHWRELDAALETHLAAWGVEVR